MEEYRATGGGGCDSTAAIPCGDLRAPSVEALNASHAAEEGRVDAAAAAPVSASLRTSGGPGAAARFPVRVVSRPGRGRCLVASRDVSAGELLLRSHAAAAVLHPTLLATHCAACFRRPDPGGAPLSVCSRCKRVKYCGRKCQAKDWAVDHKVECRSFRSRDGVLARAWEAWASGRTPTHDELSDAMLVGRVLRRRAMEAREGGAGPVWRDGAVVSAWKDVKGMVTHRGDAERADPELMAARKRIAASLAGSRVLQPAAAAAGARDAAAAAPGSGGDGGAALKEPGEDDIVDLLCAFTANNFAVTDPLMASTGAGVYPVGALLNHSCAANAVLTYEPHTHIQAVRALRDVARGEELTHHYTDAAETTEVRRATLRRHYHFHCACQRCAPDERTPEGLRVAELERSLGGYAGDPPEGAAQEELQRTRQLLAEARAGAFAPDAAAEADALERVVDVLSRTISNNHTDLISARTAALHACLLAGRHSRALAHCDALVRVYEAVYPPHHPMLSLQQYTLGDLLRSLPREGGGDPERAVAVLRRAHQSLVVSHGADAPFTADLAGLIASL